MVDHLFSISRLLSPTCCRKVVQRYNNNNNNNIIWNSRAFQERKPYQFPGWMKNSPYYFPGRDANPRPPAHPDFIISKESHALLVRPYIMYTCI